VETILTADILRSEAFHPAARANLSADFRKIVDELPAAVYTTDARGRITYFNEAAATLWGHRPELGKSEWCGSWKLFWPDGTPLPHGECPMAMAINQQRPNRGMEAVAERPELVAITKLIDEAAERGANLTKHLLAFARKQPLQPLEVDVNSLVLEAAKLLHPTLGENVEITPLLAEDAWTALIDPNQLTTAVLNLAINARDAMPNGGKLALETNNIYLDENYAGMHSEVTPGNYVMVAVSDTGTGIPASLIERVFDPFFTTKEVGKGTGLGLSMVFGFVKQSGGHVKIYSEEGHGTSVKMYLPRATGLSQTAAEAETYKRGQHRLPRGGITSPNDGDRNAAEHGQQKHLPPSRLAGDAGKVEPQSIPPATAEGTERRN